MQARATVARQGLLFVAEEDLVEARYHSGVRIKRRIRTSYYELTHSWFLRQYRNPNELTIGDYGEITVPLLDVRFTLKTVTGFANEKVLISERAVIDRYGSTAKSRAVGEVLAQIGEGLSAVPDLSYAGSESEVGEELATHAAARLSATGFKIVLVVELLFDASSFVHLSTNPVLAAPRVRVGDFRLETLRLGDRDFTVVGSDGGRLSLSRCMLHATSKFFRDLFTENPLLGEFVFEFPFQTVNIVLVYVLTRCFLGPATFENVDDLVELARRHEVADSKFTHAINIDLKEILSEKANDATFLVKILTTVANRTNLRKIMPVHYNMVKTLLVQRHFGTVMRDFVADSTNAERRQLGELLDRPTNPDLGDYTYRMLLLDEKASIEKTQLFVFNK